DGGDGGADIALDGADVAAAVLEAGDRALVVQVAGPAAAERIGWVAGVDDGAGGLGAHRLGGAAVVVQRLQLRVVAEDVAGRIASDRAAGSGEDEVVAP